MKTLQVPKYYVYVEVLADKTTLTMGWYIVSEVKIYRVEGYMLISHDRLPTWQKFKKEVRALNEQQAIEYVYSILGSNHKLRRKHIRITSVREIPLEEVTDRRIIDLATIKGFVKIE